MNNFVLLQAIKRKNNEIVHVYHKLSAFDFLKMTIAGRNMLP
jgi:hypothetical protein